jgi:hypothetical protein
MVPPSSVFYRHKSTARTHRPLPSGRRCSECNVRGWAFKPQSDMQTYTDCVLLPHTETQTQTHTGCVFISRLLRISRSKDILKVSVYFSVSTAGQINALSLCSPRRPTEGVEVYSSTSLHYDLFAFVETAQWKLCVRDLAGSRSFGRWGKYFAAAENWTRSPVTTTTTLFLSPGGQWG